MAARIQKQNKKTGQPVAVEPKHTWGFLCTTTVPIINLNHALAPQLSWQLLQCCYFSFFCLLSRFVHALHRETMTPNRHDHNPHDRFLQRGSKKRVMELFSIYSAGWTLQSVYETTPRYTHTRTHTHNSIKKRIIWILQYWLILSLFSLHTY